MRGVFVTAVVCACSFEGGNVVPDDARSDGPTDVPPDIIVKWEVDGASKKGVPSATFEWSELLSASGLTFGPPDHLWLMQESTGVLDDSVGAADLSPTNGPTYQNAVTNWSRVAVGTSDTGVNQGFISNTIGNLNGNAYLLLLYVAVLAPPSAERSLVGIGAGPDHRYVAVTTAPVFKGTGAGVTPTLGLINPAANVHALVVKIDPASLTYGVYTEQEKLTIMWTGTGGTGPLFMVGNATIGAASARYLYGALWIGAKAQRSDADIKKMLTTLGWTVTGF